jgi:hypothetical protein
MTPRSVQGETVRLAPPVEPAFLLTDRPMPWSGMNTACASRQGTRLVSRPTMLPAQGACAHGDRVSHCLMSLSGRFPRLVVVA